MCAKALKTITMQARCTQLHTCKSQKIDDTHTRNSKRANSCWIPSHCTFRMTSFGGHELFARSAEDGINMRSSGGECPPYAQQATAPCWVIAPAGARYAQQVNVRDVHVAKGGLGQEYFHTMTSRNLETLPKSQAPRRGHAPQLGDV